MKDDQKTILTAFRQKMKPLGAERIKALQFLALITREKDPQLIEIIGNGTMLSNIIVSKFNLFNF